MQRFTAILCLLSGALCAHADPVWVPPPKTWHTAFSFTQATWDQYLEGGTTSVNLPGEVTQYELTGYAEFVPMENLSIDLEFPIVFSQRKFVFLETDYYGAVIGTQLGPNGEIRDVDNNVGLGDVKAGAKYIFWDRSVSLGVHPYVKFPGTYKTGDVANAPGDGQTDLGLGLLAGSYFAPIRAYLRGSLNLVYRTGVPENQFEILIEPGVYITKNLLGRFLYEHIEQVGGDEFDSFTESAFYPGLHEDTDRIGVGLAYKATDRFGVFATYQQTVAGRNTANTKAFTLGVDFSF